MTNDLRIEKNIQDSAGEQRYRDALMARGPHLADDGVTLVVPSHVYHPDAAAFWRAQGFRWDRDYRTWERDTRKPLRGRRYPVEVWLSRARAKYKEFWPLWREGDKDDAKTADDHV
jgi:hypothetical protein